MNVKLKDIASLITKGTTPTTLGFCFQSQGVKFVKVESFEADGTFILSKTSYISEDCNEALKRSQLKENDILFSIAGAIGRVAVVTKDMLPCNTNQALAIIRISDSRVYLPYIKLVLSSSYVSKQFNKLKQGVAQLNLSLTDVGNLEIPLPEYAEQESVSRNLERLQTCISARRAQLAKLDELVKCRFIEMFGDPVANPMGWATKSMHEVAPHSPIEIKTEDNDIWLLNLDKIESHTGRVTEYVYNRPNEIGTSTCGFDNRHVLYSKLRPYLNKVVVPNKSGMATSELLALRPNEALNREFLAHLLRSDNFVGYISEKVAGAKMPRVSMDIFRSFPCILPPMPIQNTFADFVHRIDKLRIGVQAALDKAQTLFDSLMQEYFG